MRFVCPRSMQIHAAQVLAGEYDVPIETNSAHVLDIGANVGAFALWASRRWQAVRLHCYEPHPDNYRLLVENVSEADCHEVAVCTVPPIREPRIVLYSGRNNCGEASIFSGPEQSDREHVVRVLDPTELPPAAIVKVDTEGCELDILSHYPHLGSCSGVMYEWHSAEDRAALAKLLVRAGLTLFCDTVRRPDRGVAKWVRT